MVKCKENKFGDEKLKEILFGFYWMFYIFLYLGFLMVINLLHSSYSMVSVTAITLPFLVFLTFQLALWKGNRDRFFKGKNIMITILGCLLPLCCAVLLGINEYKSHFTVEKWLDNESSRVYMVDDLMKKYQFEEMTLDEVTDLLGTPPETNYFKEVNNIVYYLGDERGLISIDSEWLIFEFDENQKVKAYEIVRD